MAMQGASNPAYDVSRLGQTNLTGDVRDLFLKLYAGEVLTAFEAKNYYDASYEDSNYY